VLKLLIRVDTGKLPLRRVEVLPTTVHVRTEETCGHGNVLLLRAFKAMYR